MANPLPRAAVVLPTESRASQRSLTLLPRLAICAMPAELSAMGP